MSATSEALFDQGLYFYREGRFQDALASFKEGLGSDAGHWEMRLYLAMTHARLGNLADAKREFLTVRDLCPNNELRKKAASALGAVNPVISQQSIKKLAES